MYKLCRFDRAYVAKQRQPDGSCIELDGVEQIECNLLFDSMEEVNLFLSIYQDPISEAVRFNKDKPVRKTKWADYVPLTKKQYAELRCAKTLAHLVGDMERQMHMISARVDRLCDPAITEIDRMLYIASIEGVIMTMAFDGQ